MLCVETLISSKLRLIVLRTRLATYKSLCFRCWRGRLKQFAIERSLHSASVPLRLSLFFVTIVCVNIGLCHEISHQNKCRRRLCGIERWTKEHVWYFFKFERCMRLRKIVNIGQAYWLQWQEEYTCMAILCASYVKSKSVLQMSFLNVNNRQL